jgi:hypothetical protein
MSLLDASLAGLSHHDQITALYRLRDQIPARLQALAVEQIRALAPLAVRVTWTGDIAHHDDGTSAPYVVTNALVMRDGQSVSLPLESDLGCGVDWWESIDFGAFADGEAKETFLGSLETAKFDPASDFYAAENLAFARLGSVLGSLDVRALIGAITTLAEADPFGEAYELDLSIESSHARA